MATAMRVRRVRRVRRAGSVSDPVHQQIAYGYRRTRASILLMILLVGFALLWLVNGEWTAQFLMARFGISAPLAWAIHIFVSALELASPVLRPWLEGLPRFIPMLIAVLSLPFGVLDVLSSAIGITPHMLWLNVIGLELDTWRTLGGLLVAFLPEPMILWLWIALVSVVRSK